MKFGFPLFGVRPLEYGTVGKRAEEAGFESVWMPEHLVFPAEMPPTYPYSETGQPPVYPGSPLYDAWVVLAAIAAQTETIRLGTQVYILPLRNPLVTARAFTTLDQISNGRAILGVGVGWLEDEFQYTGENFRNRGKRTDEIIELLRTLWTDKVIHHQGEFYEMGPLRFEPKPVQKPHPPIEIGGASAPAFRRTAKLGDGWQGIGNFDVDGIAGIVKQLHDMRAEYGRADTPFDVTVFNSLGSTREAVERYAEIGVTRLMLGPRPESGKFTLDSILASVDEHGEFIASL